MTVMGDIKTITEDLLDDVTAQAKANARLRMNYNLHHSLEAGVQRMLNALEPGTYLRPHRHLGKEETYLVLRGSLVAFFYDDEGHVTGKVFLSPSEGKYGLEIPAGVWHSILVLQSGTVIFEVKQGPYRPLVAEEVASWSPEPADANGVAVFMEHLSALV